MIISNEVYDASYAVHLHRWEYNLQNSVLKVICRLDKLQKIL